MTQRPQLSSTQCFHFERPFLLDDVVPNTNPVIGRTMRHKFPPRPRPMEGPLAGMLGFGAAVVGGLLVGEAIGDMVATEGAGDLIFGGLSGGFF